MVIDYIDIYIKNYLKMWEIYHEQFRNITQNGIMGRQRS